MKNYVVYSLFAVVILASILLVQAISTPQSEEIVAFNTSLSLEYSNDYKGAIESLLNIYEKHKNNYLINLRLGWLYYYIGEFQISEKYYDIAIRLSNNSFEAMIGKAFPLGAAQKWNEVEAIYNQILSRDPNNYTANLRLGQIYLNKGDYKNAQKYLEVVHQLYPSEYEPNQSLGWVYYYQGQTAKAKTLFTNVLMISPKDSLATIGIKLIK